MHPVLNALVVVILWLSASASAQSAPAACTPYSIPIQSTISECGPGLTGTKYKTLTMQCPSGVLTRSDAFDVSSCKASTTNSDGMVTPEARCKIMPGACAIAPAPAPGNCASGRKWSLAGSGVAHCVDEDPVCPWGTSLKHDFLGHPSCEQNTCPSNQVLKSDGKSCGCQSGREWNGSSCVVPAPPAPPAAPNCPTNVLIDNQPCPNGQRGRMLKYRTTECNGSVSVGWNMWGCESWQ